MVIIVMGVSGSGKTTVGRLLAQRLGWAFVDADDHHAPQSIERMRRGLALSEAERRPWLQSLAAIARDWIDRGRNGVLACSALTKASRHLLRVDQERVLFVYLRGDAGRLRSRIERRQGHFFAPSLLNSQFETLQEPRRAMAVDVCEPAEALVEGIIERLRSPAGRSPEMLSS